MPRARPLTIVGYGRALRGEPAHPPKAGARFHFTLPGSVQGFRAEPTGSTRAENVVVAGERVLAVHYPAGAEARATTPTFFTPETLDIPPYGMAGSPTLYPGQRLRAGVRAGAAPARHGWSSGPTTDGTSSARSPAARYGGRRGKHRA